MNEHGGQCCTHAAENKICKHNDTPDCKIQLVLSAASLSLDGAELCLAADIALCAVGDETLGLGFALLPELPDL